MAVPIQLFQAGVEVTGFGKAMRPASPSSKMFTHSATLDNSESAGIKFTTFDPREESELKARCVVDFWSLAEKNGLDICIDGGWAVDAVLEKQTREHGDLDIALPSSRVPDLRQLMSERGYHEVPRPDSWEHNFVLQDPNGRTLDVHSYELNPDGSNAGGVPYTAEQLSGSGLVLGVAVRCVPPAWLVVFHTGYQLRENDYHDVQLLCSRFNLPVPVEYQKSAEGQAERDGLPDERDDLPLKW